MTILGPRLKCVACRIVVHEGCASELNENFTCRISFCESVRKYRECTSVPHHWVLRKQLKVIKESQNNKEKARHFGFVYFFHRLISRKFFLKESY